ncbi:MAG: tetratricopeptide repeat protein [Phycisphaeraceae bacterium]|nr:tetratricopeptide repeat protein [Phycisphaeraceae bacterium]
MLILKLKQADLALNDGRLDEAYDLLQKAAVKQHRRGQILVGRLARALGERGKDHLTAGRLQEALADCNKADKLSGNLDFVAQLRKSVCEAIQARQEQGEKRQAHVAMAQRQLDQGRLSVGEKILEQTDSRYIQAELLKNQASAKRLEIDSLVAKAGAALGRKDLENALAIVTPVTHCALSHADLGTLVTEIKRQIMDRIEEHLNQGRVDLADDLVTRIGTLPDVGSQIQAMGQAVSFCRQAAQSIEGGQIAEAGEILKKLRLLLPKASWLKTAVQHAQGAQDALDELRTGPLSLIVFEPYDACPSPTEAMALPPKAPVILPNPVRAIAAPPVFGTFILQIDGVGSFYVLPQSTVRVGPISSSKVPDLPLMTQPHIPSIEVMREDGDYLLRGSGSVQVNGVAVAQKCLTDGDRIQLSDKCRLKFNLPNAASTSATLVLSGTRMSRPDINYCVLMDREILIGPGCNNHIRSDRMDHTFALMLNQGRLTVKNANQLMVNHKPVKSTDALPLNTPIRIDGLTLVITDAKA